MGLPANTAYYYKVRAVNGNGAPVFGPVTPVMGRTLVPPPLAPTTPQIPAVTTGTITVTWVDASNNELNFYIERSLNGSTGFTQIGVVGAGVTSYVDANLPAGTQYYYRVQAHNSGGDSGYTTPVAGKTATLTVSGIFAPPPGLKECYVYPNPARGSDPVIRAMMGGVDVVEITIYDQSGQAVKSDRVTASTMVNGEMAYEYRWTEAKTSGVYYAIVHGKKGSEEIRARASFAVVR
jgi:hypothetical protein